MDTCVGQKPEAGTLFFQRGQEDPPAELWESQLGIRSVAWGPESGWGWGSIPLISFPVGGRLQLSPSKLQLPGALNCKSSTQRKAGTWSVIFCRPRPSVPQGRVGSPIYGSL